MSSVFTTASARKSAKAPSASSLKVRRPQTACSSPSFHPRYKPPQLNHRRHQVCAYTTPPPPTYPHLSSRNLARLKHHNSATNVAHIVSSPAAVRSPAPAPPPHQRLCSRHTSDLPLWSRRPPQYPRHRPPRPQLGRPLRYVQPQVLHQDSLHGSKADGATRSTPQHSWLNLVLRSPESRPSTRKTSYTAISSRTTSSSVAPEPRLRMVRFLICLWKTQPHKVSSSYSCSRFWHGQAIP